MLGFETPGRNRERHPGFDTELSHPNRSLSLGPHGQHSRRDQLPDLLQGHHGSQSSEGLSPAPLSLQPTLLLLPSAQPAFPAACTVNPDLGNHLVPSQSIRPGHSGQTPLPDDTSCFSRDRLLTPETTRSGQEGRRGGFPKLGFQGPRGPGEHPPKTNANGKRTVSAGLRVGVAGTMMRRCARRVRARK